MEIDHTDLVLKLINSDGDALVDSSTKYYLLIDATAIDNSNLQNHSLVFQIKTLTHIQQFLQIIAVL